MLIKDLQKIGFGKNTAHVYLSLVSLGEAKAGEIIKKTGLHRNIVYTALETMEEKKLIMKTDDRGVALYKVLDPARMLDEVREKEQIAQTVIEELRAIRKLQSQEIIIYEGEEEIRRAELGMYERMGAGETLQFLGHSAHWYRIMGKNLKNLLSIQRKKQFMVQGIGSQVGKDENEYMNESKGLTTFKSSPEMTSQTNEVTILPDRVLIKIFVEPFTAVEIVNREVAESYRHYFQLLWQQHVRTYTGWAEVQRLFCQELIAEFKTGGREYVIGAGYGPNGDDKRVKDLFRIHNGSLFDLNIEKYALFYERHRKEFAEEVSEMDAKKLAHVRYLPDEFYFPMEIHICNRKATVTYFGDTPVSTVYEHDDIISGFRKQFDLMWSLAKD